MPFNMLIGEPRKMAQTVMRQAKEERLRQQMAFVPLAQEQQRIDMAQRGQEQQQRQWEQQYGLQAGAQEFYQQTAFPTQTGFQERGLGMQEQELGLRRDETESMIEYRAGMSQLEKDKLMLDVDRLEMNKDWQKWQKMNAQEQGERTERLAQREQDFRWKVSNKQIEVNEKTIAAARVYETNMMIAQQKMAQGIPLTQEEFEELNRNAKVLGIGELAGIRSIFESPEFLGKLNEWSVDQLIEMGANPAMATLVKTAISRWGTIPANERSEIVKTAFQLWQDIEQQERPPAWEEGMLDEDTKKVFEAAIDGDKTGIARGMWNMLEQARKDENRGMDDWVQGFRGRNGSTFRDFEQAVESFYGETGKSKVRATLNGAVFNTAAGKSPVVEAGVQYIDEMKGALVSLTGGLKLYQGMSEQEILEHAGQILYKFRDGYEQTRGGYPYGGALDKVIRAVIANEVKDFAGRMNKGDMFNETTRWYKWLRNLETGNYLTVKDLAGYESVPLPGEEGKPTYLRRTRQVPVYSERTTFDPAEGD